METTSTTIPSPRPDVRAIFWGGLIAGALDITAAFVQWALRGVSPIRILQAIASGVLGPGSFQTGTGSAALGLVLHFVIAFGAATVYFMLSHAFPFLVRRPVLGGVIYGTAVHGFMQFVVLPMSAFRLSPFSPAEFAIGLIIHILFVGLPIALAAKRFSK